MSRTTRATPTVPAPRSPAEGERRRRLLAEDLVVAVRQMRLGGASWADVGRRLGCSRQGARQRFGWMDDVPVEVRRLGARWAEFRCPQTGTVWHCDPTTLRWKGREAAVRLVELGAVEALELAV